MGTVGSGVHAQSAWQAVLQHQNEMERRLGDLELNVYKSFAIPLEVTYVTEAGKMQERYREACKRAKGTKTRVGAIKNYTFAGLMVAYTKDTSQPEGDRKVVEKMMLKEMGDTSGKLDMSRAAQLDKMVGHASVKKGVKEAYVSFKMHEQWTEVGDKLGGVLNNIGRRQWDPPTPTPVAKELRMHMEAIRKK